MCLEINLISKLWNSVSTFFLWVYTIGDDGDSFEKLISSESRLKHTYTRARARDEGGCYISIRDSTHE